MFEIDNKEMQREIRSKLNKTKSRGYLAFVGMVMLFSYQASYGIAQDLIVGAEYELEQQRDLFVQTEKLIEQRRFTEAKQHMQKLTQYPLYPYLEADFFQRNISFANEAVIVDFLQTYGSEPFTNKLRRAWLEYTVLKNRPDKLLASYTYEQNERLHCQYLQAKWKLEGDSQELWQEVQQFWVYGKSRSNVCDPVFNAWTASGKRTAEVVWQRYLLALDAKSTSLQLYLKRQLPETIRPLADKARSIKANPRYLRNFSQFKNQHPYELPLVEQGLKRLVWADIKLAERVWKHYQQTYAWDAAITHQFNELFGVALSLRGEIEESLVWFSQLEIPQLSESGRHWFFVALLKQERYEELVEFIRGLSPEVQKKNKWQYWLASSYQRVGQNTLAERAMRSLARERDYYGFLAAAHQGTAPQLNRKDFVYEPHEIEHLKNHQNLRRAIELYELERDYEARREWNRVAFQGSAREQELAAVYAYDLGYYAQSIWGFSRMRYFDDIERRFPLGYQHFITQHAQQQGLDASWVFALIRQESAYQRDARSPVGALGLMQLLPSTADYVLRRTPRHSRQRVTANRLYTPEENIYLGTLYLKELMEKLDQHWVLATASYNAGINRVLEWIPEESMPLDVWIEQIPYSETRNYVKNILAYQQIYSMLQGQNNNLLEMVIGQELAKAKNNTES